MCPNYESIVGLGLATVKGRGRNTFSPTRPSKENVPDPPLPSSFVSCCRSMLLLLLSIISLTNLLNFLVDFLQMNSV